MANEKIHEYLSTRTAGTLIGTEFLDLDATDDGGGTWFSANLTIANLLTYVNNNVNNIYSVDGTIAANRTLFALTRFTKWLGGDVEVQMADETFDYAFLVKNVSNQEKGRFGFDQATFSGILELNNNSGQFFSANDNKIITGFTSSTFSSVTNVKINGNIGATQINNIALHVRASVDNGTNSDIVLIEQTTAGGSPVISNSVLRVMGGFSVSGIRIGLKVSQHPYVSIGTEVQNLVQLNVDHIYFNNASPSSGTIATQIKNRTSRTASGLTTKKGLVVESSGVWSDSGAGNTVNTGLEVSVSGGDINYAAILTGGNVGIGTASPDPSALLDLVSTTQGIGIPRMTGAQAIAITPFDGLVLYATSTSGAIGTIGFWGYTAGAWVQL